MALLLGLAFGFSTAGLRLGEGSWGFNRTAGQYELISST